MPTQRTLMIGTTLAAAALVLTSCAENPVKHGEVIDKRGHAGSWIPEYEDLYRDNCTTIRTSSFTASLTGRPGGSSSSGGKSGSSRRTGKTDSGSDSSSSSSSSTSGGTSGTTKPGSSGSTTGDKQPTKKCDRQYVGRKKTGQHWLPGAWELKLRDGDRTGWIKVSKDTYANSDLRDQI